jgi:hypothetical protein
MSATPYPPPMRYVPYAGGPSLELPRCPDCGRPMNPCPMRAMNPKKFVCICGRMIEK